MAADSVLPQMETRWEAAVAEACCLLLGAGLTLVLFLSVAGFGEKAAPAPEPEFVDLQAMSLPLEAPPPRPLETPPVSMPATPFSGLEVEAAESPVRIAVVPPDLTELMPAAAHAPAARIEAAQLYTEFKPRTGLDESFSRIFQEHEVDQRPTVLARPLPVIPSRLRGDADSVRLSVLILIDTKGRVGNARILGSSGNKEIDEILLEDIRQYWYFTPAIKQGRKVRCLAQQAVRVKWSSSPFDP